MLLIIINVSNYIYIINYYIFRYIRTKYFKYNSNIKFKGININVKHTRN